MTLAVQGGEMRKNRLNILIGGEAGQGVISSSLTLAKVFTRGGLHAFVLNEYPNTVKGLHNWCSICIDRKPLSSQRAAIDLLIALNRDTILQHRAELSAARALVYDPADCDPSSLLPEAGSLRLYPLPMSELVKSRGGGMQMRNSAAIGATLALVDYDFSILGELLEELFRAKGAGVARENIDLARAGYDYARRRFKGGTGIVMRKQVSPPLMLLSGNEAICLGAIRAGAKLLAAYPMTPTSSIIHYLAACQEKFRLVVKHTEDEIGAVNMAIGANFAGVRSFVCTSGGGFSLMTEGLGLAGMTETPLVCVVGQRPGPATGQPTHTAQGDLRFLIHASQGEFPRIVIAPGDVEECFYETFNAFNLAEIFQTPVLILSDKYLGESYRSCPKFDSAGLKIERGKLLDENALAKQDNYRRYLFVRDGISPRALPGQAGGIHTATSYEHDEDGFYEERPAAVARMLEKRWKKQDSMRRVLPAPKRFGKAEAKVALISWGSTKGVILQALPMLRAAGVEVCFHQLVYLHPFPAQYVAALQRRARMSIVVEHNQSGQLAALIRENTGREVDAKLLKYDGQPFYPAELAERVMEVLK